MLSEHERKVLSELEADLLAEPVGWRARARQALHACPLPALLLALATVLAVTAVALLPAAAALGIAIPIAIALGWTGSGVARRHGLSLWVRAALRRRRESRRRRT